MFSPSLSVLAVAIFSFRKTNLMKVQSYNAAEVMYHSTLLIIIPVYAIEMRIFCYYCTPSNYIGPTAAM